MLLLKLVKGADLPGSEEEQFGNKDESLLHGTDVLKHVVSPWFGSNWIVCADSYLLLQRNCSVMASIPLEW